ncbi:unnamed protein product [Bemisia tabaci]|uniref:Cytochrome b5 n=1 Tax=Bemisia tabaci TaxID=7038 RepID=A0A9N9ZWQ8_BEMTA|nr:unnamed protein product [Bemisia tabaci]
MTEASTVFTMEKIKQLASKNRTIFVINNEVYDVSKFLDEHPGGEEVLQEHAGKDASETFEDVGHSSDAREMMVKFKIGELCESDKKALQSKKDKNKASATTSISDNFSTYKSGIISVVVAFIVTYIYSFYI